MEPQLQSATPPVEFFDRPKDQVTAEEQVMRSGEAMHIFTGKIETPPEGGMYLYFKDVPFPKKGFAYPAAAYAGNLIKRQTIMMLMSLAAKEMLLPAIAFLFIPYKKKISILENFLRQYWRNADYVLAPHYLKESYLSPCSHELMKATRTFLTEIGISELFADRTARILSLLVEIDNTYRYRIEDLMSETSKETLLANPRKELKKLMIISRDRDYKDVSAKFVAFMNVALYIMVYPKIKRAFKKTFEQSDFARFQLDEADRYHVLNRNDYKYMGKSIEERMKIYATFHTRSACCDAKVQESPVFGEGYFCENCTKACGVIEEYPQMVMYQGQ